MENHSLKWAAISCALMLPGCSSTPEKIDENVSIRTSPIRYETTAIGIISDTQIHESRGTASKFFSKAGDEAVEVTIRTGQQVIGSTDMLVEALHRLSDTPLILHVGDATDVSCQTEWDAFTLAMKIGRSDNQWVLVEGNHDGFFVGNAIPSKDTKYNVGYWNQICNQGRYALESPQADRHFDKNMMLLANIRHFQNLNPHHLRLATLPTRQTCKVEDNTYTCASWSLSPEQPWRSYLLQTIRLPQTSSSSPKVYALALDSSTYDEQPTISLWSKVIAGTQAGFTLSQLQDANALIRQLPKDAKFFLTAHHNLMQWKTDSLPKDQHSELESVVKDPRFLGFALSGHTHEGGWYNHKILGQPVLELNTGSLADAPLYVRDLKFLKTENGEWRVQSNRNLLTSDSIHACKNFELPKNGSGYSVDEQRSENDRLHDAPYVVRQLGRFFSAAHRLFTFWHSKHDELKPQLLTYRDVVRAALPVDTTFTYARWEGDKYPRLYKTRLDLEKRLEYLASCYDAEACSVTEKGNLLKKLEDDLGVASKHYSAEVITKAHSARLCAAVAATEEAGRNEAIVQEVLKSSRPTEMLLPVVDRP